MKKLFLEFIRGAAALVVLLYHFLEMHPTSQGAVRHYFSNWGTDAVIVFFILSGLVINISQSNNPKSKKQFLINRLIRIYPQLLAGIILGLLVLYVTGSTMPSVLTIIGNLLMISTLKSFMQYIVPCIASNNPIWSLSFEMFFYLVFALTIGRFQKTALVIWFIISLAVMPLYYSALSVGALGHVFAVIAFSSIWLVGYYVYEFRNYIYTDKYTALFSAGVLPLISHMHTSTIYYDPLKYLLFALFAIPVFRYCLQEPEAGKKIKWYYLLLPFLVIVYVVFQRPYITFKNWVLYSGLPIALMATCFGIELLHLKAKAVNFINATGQILGKYSYSIYISHYPVLFFCAVVFHNLWLYTLISLPCVIMMAYCFENYLQKTVVNYFRKINKTRRPVAA